jgi:hypothetical protein
MKSLFVPRTQNERLQVLAVGLMLALLVAFMIPQLSWADHASDHPYSQYDDPTIVSTSDADGAWLAAQTMATGQRYAQSPAAQAWFLANENSETVTTSSCADWRTAQRYAQGPAAEAWFLAQEQAQLARADASSSLCIQ